MNRKNLIRAFVVLALLAMLPLDSVKADASAQAPKPVIDSGFVFKRLMTSAGDEQYPYGFQVTDIETQVPFQIHVLKPKRGAKCTVVDKMPGQKPVTIQVTNASCKSHSYVDSDGVKHSVALKSIQPFGVDADIQRKFTKAEVKCIRDQVNIFLAARALDPAYPEVLKRHNRRFIVNLIDATDKRRNVTLADLEPLSEFAPGDDSSTALIPSEIQIALVPVKNAPPKCVIEDAGTFAKGFAAWKKSDEAANPQKENPVARPSGEITKLDAGVADATVDAAPKAPKAVDAASESSGVDAGLPDVDPYKGVPDLESVEIQGSATQ